MNKLRINLIQPRANLAGGTKSGRLLMEGLVRRGHDVRILYPSRVARPRSLRPGAWRQWCQLRRVAMSGGHHLAVSTASLIAVSGTRVREADAPDADVTVANFWKCREWMNGWGTRTGVPALFVRGHVVRGHADRIAAAYRAPGVNFVTSSYLASCVAGYGDSSPIVVPNGLDPLFDAPRRTRQVEPTVGFMFSPSPLKGPDVALRAIEAIRVRIPGLRVITFGSASPSRQWPLPEGAQFHLRPAQKDIPSIYASCDVWLQPSRNEGFALPGLEAFGCHTPVVSTLCGGPDEYIQNGVNGYLVPVEDHEAMAERAIEILRMPEERWREMSEAAYQRSREFTWDRSAEQFEAAIYRILSGEHPIRT